MAAKPVWQGALHLMELQGVFSAHTQTTLKLSIHIKKKKLSGYRSFLIIRYLKGIVGEGN